MDTDPPEGKQLGKALLAAAYFLFAVALVLLVTTTSAYPILFSVLSLFIGLTGFKQLEQPPIPPPPPMPIGYDVDLIESTLKDGQVIYVHFDITFSPDTAPSHTREMIKTRLQRALNIFTDNILTYPIDPYAELEAIFRNAVIPLCRELGLNAITVHVVKVGIQKFQEQEKPIPTGIHFRN